MPQGSKIFLPCRSLGYVSNHIPLQVRYIKSRKENLVVTCVGKAFHTYGISHFSLLSVSGLHPGDIQCMTSDNYHVYTACGNIIYAWRRGTELKHTYFGHKNAVCLMIPFGSHLISVDELSNVKIWDIKEEHVYFELTFNNKFFHITAILHPSTYINKILFGSSQGSMELWNINTAKQIYKFKGWSSPITCLEQAPALDVVAVGLHNGKIILHNLKYDEIIMEFTQDWGPVISISFRSDGHPIMATGSTKGHVVFWNLEEQRVTSQLLAAHENSVTGIICLPSEPLMLTSSPDNTLKLWIFDMTDGGARLLRIREGHSAVPTFIRFHGSNGHNILSAGEDSSLRIFNTQTEQFNKSLGKASYSRKISKKRGRAVQDPLIMPPIVEFTSETTREKEWDNIASIHLGLPITTTWSYHKLKMGEIKLLPERLKKKNLEVDEIATCLSFTRCGNFVLIGYNSGHCDRFNIQSGLWRDSYGNSKAHDTSVRGVSTDGLNQVTITGSSKGEIKFWSFRNKSKPPLKKIIMDDSINFFRAHSESSLLAVALVDFTIHILDIDTKTIIRKFIGHTASITDATFSPDSRWLITSSMDCSIRTWNIPSSQLIDQFKTESACISLTMSPTGDLLATAHVNYLGIFLWCNQTLYSNVTLKALTPNEEPALVVLPEIARDVYEEELSVKKEDEPEFISPDQLSKQLVTLSDLPSSRWQNLLNIDVIRKRNKPKQPPKVPKAAPFFLPTIASLSLKFNLNEDIPEAPQSKLLSTQIIVNMSEFGKILDKTQETNDFKPVVQKLKSLGPSMIEFEIKSLEPEGGGSWDIMLQFLKTIEFMLKTNKDFELAQSYLSIFLKIHGKNITYHESLRRYLTNVQSCSLVSWNRIQEKLLYSLCVIQSKKSL